MQVVDKYQSLTNDCCMNKQDISDQLFSVDETQFSNNDVFFPSNFRNHNDEIDFLKQQGFATNPFNSEAETLEEAWKSFEELGIKRAGLQYPIDGLVIKLNDNEISTAVGVVGKTPRTWSALKYAAEEVTTRLLDISWQVGRTGKVTPVADLEPVELAGTTVKRASLHNYKEVLDRDLHFLDTLVVRKAGDIIPEVVEVLVNLRKKPDGIKHGHFDENGKLEIPTSCPSCKTVLKTSKTGVDLFCPNGDECKEQIILRLSYFCQRNMANITGLSDKILERFIKEFGVHDIYDIYTLPFDKIATLDGFGEKSASNLKKSLENAMEFEDWKFLAALGIDGVGPEVAKLICENLRSFK
jgi:DNA ligase (NAD+)